MTNTLVLLEPEQLFNEIKKAVKISLAEHDRERVNKDHIRLYTINQIAKKLNKSHSTISRLVKDGVIKSTKDGLVTEQELNNYLAGE
jgi:excisionase family DNA binding protein